MQSELGDPGALPAVIQASLQYVKKGPDGKARLVGTIANLSAAPLTDVLVRTGSGHVILPEPIKVGGTANIDLPLNTDEREIQARVDEQYQYRYYNRSSANPYSKGSLGSIGLGLATCDIAINRSRQIEAILGQRPDLACVCAQSQGVAPAVKLMQAKEYRAMEQHYQVIRALVELKQVEQQ